MPWHTEYALVFVPRHRQELCGGTRRRDTQVEYDTSVLGVAAVFWLQQKHSSPADIYLSQIGQFQVVVRRICRLKATVRRLFRYRGKRKPRRMKKGQGRALAFGRRLNGGGLTPGLARMALVRVRREVIVVLVRTIRMRLVWMRRIGRRMVRAVLWLVRPSVGSFRR